LSAVLIAIALVASTACVALAGAHLRRVLRSTSPEVRSLAIALKRLPLPSRAEELARRARPESWEHQFAQAVLEASGDQARIAAANDALADMEITLSAGASWPGTAVRVCARIVLFLAVLAFLVQRSTDGILAVLVIGGAGVVACAAIGRRSRLEARERREAVDALVAAVLGPLAPRPSSKHA